MSLGKCYCLPVSFLCKLVYLGAAGVPKAYCPGHLIENLSCRIIHCPAKYVKVGPVLYYYKVCVPSGHHKSQVRGLKLRVFHIICRNMPFDMIYSDKGFSCCKGQCFCK